MKEFGMKGQGLRIKVKGYGLRVTGWITGYVLKVMG